MERNRAKHEQQHMEDIQRLSAVTTPQHVQENDLAQSFRKNKLPVRMSKYSFEVFCAYSGVCFVVFSWECLLDDARFFFRFFTNAGIICS